MLNCCLQSFLGAKGRNLTPQDYILQRLTIWIIVARRGDTRIVAGGDFNLDHEQVLYCSKGRRLQRSPM